MGRIMRRIGTGSATQRVELGGTTDTGSIVKIVTKSASTTVSANNSAWLSQSDFGIQSIDNYTFVGVIGYHITGTFQTFVRAVDAGDATDFLALTNVSSSQVNAYVSIRCLYVRTDKIG